MQQLSIDKGNMEQQMQELAETIQQLRQSQLTLAAENERLREGQAGVQALAQSVGELAQSLKRDTTDRKTLTDSKGLGRFGCRSVWPRLRQGFGKLFGFRRPHRLSRFGRQSTPRCGWHIKGWRTTVSGVVPSMHWGKRRPCCWSR